MINILLNKAINDNNLLLAFKYSCEILNFKLGKYLLLIRQDYDIKYCMLTNTFSYKIKKDNLKMISTLIDSKYEYYNQNHLFLFSCLNGFLLTLQHLKNTFQLMNVDFDFGLCCACLNGHINVVKWLLENNLVKNINMYFDGPFSTACLNGHIKIAKFLTTQSKYITYDIFDYEIFHNACKTNKLNIVKWYCEFTVPQHIISIGLNYAFRYGSLSIIKFMYHNSIYTNFQYNSNNNLKIACDNGHLKIIKWYLMTFPFENVPEKNNYLFISACKNGHLKIIKYLISQNQNIDISMYNELPLKYACWSGYTNIIKYLLSIKKDINIEIDDDIIFNLSCVKNKIESIKILMGLNEKYYAIINNNIVKKYGIIKTKNNNQDYELHNEIKNCLVCYENSCTIITNCGHQYCKNCIFTWLNDNDTCPYCRTIINEFFKISKKIDNYLI